MNIPFMRFMDRFLGAWALGLLVPFAWAFRLVRPPVTVPERVKHVLFIKCFGIGSIINTIPAIEATRAHFPDARIGILTFSFNAEFIKIFGIAEDLIFINISNFPRFVFSTIKAVFRIWRLGPDIVFDMEFFSNYTTLLSVLSLSPVRCGFFAYFKTRNLLNTHSAAYGHYCHISRSFMAIPEACGVPPALKGKTEIRLPSVIGEFGGELNEVLPKAGKGPTITVNVNASKLCRLRLWPAENYAALLQRLTAEFPGYSYVLIGSATERDYVQSVIDQAGLPEGALINLAGRTSAGGLMALLEKTRLLISNDSGPVHIAAGYGIDEVALYGPETPVSYGPLNPRARIFYEPPYCSPCLHVLDNKQHLDCLDVKCMKGIKVDAVFKAVSEILNENAA